ILMLPEFVKLWVVMVWLPSPNPLLSGLSVELPSCNCRIGVMLPPQLPEAVKVNGRATAAPPAATIPYGWGSLGELTPFVANNVTTRLVVFAVPEFVREKFIVTVSPGSMTPLVEKQFSNSSVV